MKMTDMKRTKKERKEANKCVPYEGEDYAYGLQVRLGEEEIDKLGLSMPTTGDKFILTAVAKVSSTSTNERGGETRKSIEFQITKLAVEKQSKSALEALNEGIKEAKS